MVLTVGPARASLCYFVNIMDLVWLWCFPSSAAFFITCYCLTLGATSSFTESHGPRSRRLLRSPTGPIASAIVTWRNSLVFHSLDKVTSLFIHMYPPMVLSMIVCVRYGQGRAWCVF